MDSENTRLRHLIDRVEEALKEHETRFRLLFELSPYPVFLVEDYRFVACNEAALQTMERSDREMLLGLRLSQISPEVQPDGQRSSQKEKRLFSLATNRGRARFEWVCNTLGGTILWVDVSLITVPIRGKPATYMVWHDITEKKKREEDLRKREAEYRDILDNVGSGIFQVDLGGQLTNANKALAVMCGYVSPGEMVEANVRLEDKFVNPEHGARLRQFFRDQYPVQSFDAELYRKDRSKVWVSVNTHSVSNAAGQIIYYEGFVEDITRRKALEEALRKEKESLLTILNNDPMGVILSDPGGTYLYVNQEFTNVTGYTREDVPTGSDWFEKAYPDPRYRRKVLDVWQRTIKSGEWSDVEFTIACKDGQTKDIEFRSTALQDYNITVLKDVTKRKQAEKALQESEEKFRLLFDKSADPVFLLDKTRFVDCNEAALSLIGCPHKGQLLGLHTFDISPKLQPDGSDSEERAREAVKAALREGTNHVEWALRRFDDKEIIVDGSFTVIKIQGKRVLYTVWRDITDRKRAEDALMRTERKFKDIFENATEGIFQTSIEGSLLAANPAFAHLLGYESSEEILNSVKNVAYDLYIEPERRTELRHQLEKQGFVHNFEVEFRRKDGETIWINMNIKTVRNKEGKVRFYEGTLTDITEQKCVQETLENKSRSLEDANAALNALLKHREQDSRELEEKVVTNIKELVLPYVERLKTSKSQANQAIVDIIESNLGEIMSPFISRMAARYENFTPREIRIADLIKKGKTTKEISQALGLSIRTVDIHRFNIRRKLNLNKRKINLQSYLLSISGSPSG